MRGKADEGFLVLCHHGITPAYAGKSTRPCSSIVQYGDHPRVCGEKFGKSRRVNLGVGSPPRMRGKAPPGRFAPLLTGITPAYAGKRLMLCHRPPPRGDHPRVCGEKFGVDFGSTTCYRITPAYAGKSWEAPVVRDSAGDHPRVCGEKVFSTMLHHNIQGSPPRMRGKV